MPVLFITGALDQNSTPEMSSEMADLAQNATLDIVEEPGHMMPMTHSHYVNRRLRTFFD